MWLRALCRTVLRKQPGTVAAAEAPVAGPMGTQMQAAGGKGVLGSCEARARWVRG